MKKFLFNHVIPPILYVILRLWLATLRLKVLTPEQEQTIRDLPGRLILTSWHNRIFLDFYHFRGRRDIAILVSPSTDGDLLARVCKLMGYHVVRGSSYKNAFSGSRQMISLLKKDWKVGIIADGSRGPRYQLQASLLQLARITGASVCTVSWDARWKYQLNSWDRFILPLPFSSCQIAIGPLLTLARNADDHEIAKKNELLQRHLEEIGRQCQYS